MAISSVGASWALGRAFLFGTLLLFLFGGFVLAGGRYTNPQVQAGSNAVFPATGTQSPQYSTWIVAMSNGTDVGNGYSARGWTVSYNSGSGNFTVGAPSTATVATGYTVKYNQGVVKSATFDVISGGGTVPPAPTGVNAVAAPTVVNVQWTAAPGATSYNLKWCTTAGGPYTSSHTGITTNAYTVSGLTNGTTYYFVVTGVNTYGESPNSTEVSGTPAAAIRGYVTDYVEGSLNLVDAQEMASAPSTSYAGGVVTTANMHVFQLSLQLPTTVGWVAPHANDPIPGGLTTDGNYYVTDSTGRPPTTPGQAPHFINNGMTFWESNPSDFTPPTYSNWMGGADAANDTCLPNDIRPGGTTYSVYVIAPGCAGFGGSGTNVRLTQNGSGQPALTETLTPGQTALVQEAAVGPLPAGTLQVVLTTNKWWHKLVGYYNLYTSTPDGNGGFTYHYSGTQYWWSYCSSTTYKVYTYNLRRTNADSASIDSRLVYGNPDITGEIQADANASARNPIFNPYIFRGGLFVGNMPYGGTDESGTARLQVFGDISANSQTIWATLTAFYIGYPSAAPNGARIYAFTPADGDGNIGVASNAAMWSTKWLAGTPNGSYLDFTTSTAPNAFYNWRLNSPSQTLTVKAALKLENEASTSPVWFYFASPTWEAAQTIWPGNDSRPRVWMIDQPPVGGWTE